VTPCLPHKPARAHTRTHAPRAHRDARTRTLTRIVHLHPPHTRPAPTPAHRPSQSLQCGPDRVTARTSCFQRLTRTDVRPSTSDGTVPGPLYMSAYRDRSQGPLYMSAYRDRSQGPLYMSAYRDRSQGTLYMSAYRDRSQGPLYMSVYRDRSQGTLYMSAYRDTVIPSSRLIR
jgi:hypothetical protein